MNKEKEVILIVSIILVLIPLFIQPRLNAIFSGEEHVIAIAYSGDTPKIMRFHYLLGLSLGCITTWTYIREKYQVPIFILMIILVVLQTIFMFQVGRGVV